MEFVALVDSLGVIGLMVTGILFLAAIGLLLFDRRRLPKTDEHHATTVEHQETRTAA